MDHPNLPVRGVRDGGLGQPVGTETMTGDLRHPTKEESEHIIRETKIMAAILAPAVFGTFTDDTEPMMLAMALTRHITFLLRKYPEHQSRHNAKVIAEMIVQLASLPENPPTMQAG